MFVCHFSVRSIFVDVGLQPLKVSITFRNKIMQFTRNLKLHRYLHLVHEHKKLAKLSYKV